MTEREPGLSMCQQIRLRHPKTTFRTVCVLVAGDLIMYFDLNLNLNLQ